MGKKSFEVSVIIPVYNAERYLRESVESAIPLSQVGEIILVEDGSPDNALQLCIELSEEYEKVRLFRHPNGKNKGAGLSRNLGVEKAIFEYIAFLDADDVYLPNRFIRDASLFQSNRVIDGVYNVTGKYENRKDLGLDGFNFKYEILPKDVLYNMLTGGVIFDVNGITLKKELFFKAGGFNGLELHEDTHLWYKVAHYGNLQPGSMIEPVALTRNHDKRRIFSRSKESKIKFYGHVLETFSTYRNPDVRFVKSIINKFCVSKSKFKFMIPIEMIKVFIKYPSLFKIYIL